MRSLITETPVDLCAVFAK